MADILSGPQCVEHVYNPVGYKSHKQNVTYDAAYMRHITVRVWLS